MHFVNRLVFFLAQLVLGAVAKADRVSEGNEIENTSLAFNFELRAKCLIGARHRIDELG